MNRRTSLFTLAFAVTSAFFAQDTVSEAAEVKGTNVKMVIYGNNGTTLGTFVQTAPGTWVERNKDGQFNFREEGRDEWSVYLVKVGRQEGQKVQLDLHRKTVSTGNYVFYQIMQTYN